MIIACGCNNLIYGERLYWKEECNSQRKAKWKSGEEEDGMKKMKKG